MRCPLVRMQAAWRNARSKYRGVPWITVSSSSDGRSDWGLCMSPNLALISDGKKFMWDGCFYTTRDEAAPAQEAYLMDKFQVRVVEDAGRFLVYTRRVVKEVVVTVQ